MSACGYTGSRDLDVEPHNSYSEIYKRKYKNAEDSYSYPYNARRIPRYNYSEDFPLYNEGFRYSKKYKVYTGKYPIYDPDADNQYPTPMPQQQPQTGYYDEYPIYDPDADNPYYPGQVYIPFDKKIYDGYYPKYDSDADNPYYPEPKGETLFDKPMFDTPMFTN